MPPVRISCWGRYTFTREKYRQLKKAVVGGKTTNYKYNAEGIRTEKTISGEYTDTYRLNGTRVVGMTRNSADGTVNLAFIYDENGRPYSLERYNSSGIVLEKYHYITNVQGDVIRLIDENNEVIANYAYDAWGKLISITDAGGNAITASNHIAIRNPIRYRGYFYDEDTKLYYCNSRYYDPQTRRFINADGTVSISGCFNGFNMFTYCNNNPVMCYDPDGNDWLWAPLAETHRWGYVHSEVVKDICVKNGYLPEARLSNCLLRADVVDVTNGYVWEVKHANLKGTGIETAEKSLMKYVGKSLSGSSDESKVLNKGPAGIIHGEITREYLGETYYISYSSPASGVVLYSFTRSGMQEEKQPETSKAHQIAPSKHSYHAPTRNNVSSGVGVGLVGAAIVSTAYIGGACNRASIKTYMFY